MIYKIPGQGDIEINTIILDLNGTLSVAGQVPDGVKDRLAKLKQMRFKIVLFTGNTRNDADELCKDLGIEWNLAKNTTDKQNMALQYEPQKCASIGNGLIDRDLMKTVKLRIVTLQAEGVHIQTLLQSDILVPNINDALDLFIDEQRLVATLRQ